MIFSRQKVATTHNLFIAGTLIQRKSEARFLGVIVDDKLSWAPHIKTLKTKMSRYVGIMYKIKNSLPIQARLQIFHSFVQSHINFCSLIWGFASRSHIESLFVNQKKGMRAVMPGYVNFFFKDGVLPAHTKPAFSKFKILTVHGVIAKNALVFMHKVNNFPRSLPVSIRETIASDAPSGRSDHETCEAWLTKLGNGQYRNSIFYKGPLLAADPKCCDFSTLATFLTIKAYKNNVKRGLLSLQTNGDENEWQMDNFLLFNISGLRRSSRLN